jgi:hypothetical protein
MEILGVPVRLDPALPWEARVVMQVRFPRSKKRRIREKWHWRTENYKRFTVKALFVEGGDPPGLAMHPSTWEWFQEIMA